MKGKGFYCFAFVVFMYLCGYSQNHSNIDDLISKANSFYQTNQDSALFYADPTSDVVTFSNSNISTIEIYDIAGKFLTSAKGNTISVKSLSNGIYLIKGISNEGWNTIKRLIKN